MKMNDTHGLLYGPRYTMAGDMLALLAHSAYFILVGAIIILLYIILSLDCVVCGCVVGLCMCVLMFDARWFSYAFLSQQHNENRFTFYAHKYIVLDSHDPGYGDMYTQMPAKDGFFDIFLINCVRACDIRTNAMKMNRHVDRRRRTQLNQMIIIIRRKGK